MAIVLHLAVHLLGVAVAAGLALFVTRRGPDGTRVLDGVARRSVLAGAAALIGAYLAVGGLVAEPDGWPLLLRAAGYAAIAVGVAGGPRVAVAPAVALLPGTLSLAAGVAGLAAAVATLSGVLGRGREVVALGAGLALYAAGDLLVATRPGLAAAASLAGSAAAGAWLLQRAARRSLAGRVTGASLVLLVLAVLGVAAGSGLVLTADVQAEQRQRLTAVAAAQAGDLTDRAGAGLEATATALAGASLAGPLEDDDRALAAARTENVTALPDVDVVVLLAADGQVVAATRRDGPLPPAAALAIAGTEAADQALAGGLARGVVDLGDGTLLTLGAAPVAPTADDGRPLLLRQAGALVLGRTLTAAPVVERIAADTAADVAIVVGDGAVTASEALVGLDPAGLADGRLDGEDGSRLVATAPLGDPARGTLVLALPADLAADASATATRSTFLLAVVGLLAVGGVAAVLGRRIALPVADLTATAERVAAGELDVAVPRPAGDDEVARLADAFRDMTGSLASRDTDLRGALAEQAALRAELEAITASMGEALLATDADGRVVTANRAAAGLLEVPVDRLVGRPLAEVLVGRAEPGGGSLVDALASDGAVAVRGELAAGRIVEASAAPLADGDRPGRVHVIRDVTDRALADRVRTEVIANLSHELNTPLTPIKAFLEVVAARRAVDPRFEPMLELAREGRARLERTIGALVDLAELEAGRRVVADDPVAVRPVVAALIERWRGREPHRRITRRLERDLPAVQGDEELLGRALDELVDNACKFSTGPVRITGRRVLRAGVPTVELSVHDRGPGIAPEHAAEVLEPFVQLDGSATRDVGGLGIGLPLAQRMIASCGGVLELSPAPGGGTEARVRLPAVAAPSAAADDGAWDAAVEVAADLPRTTDAGDATVDEVATDDAAADAPPDGTAPDGAPLDGAALDGAPLDGAPLDSATDLARGVVGGEGRR